MWLFSSELKRLRRILIKEFEEAGYPLNKISSAFISNNLLCALIPYQCSYQSFSPLNSIIKITNVETHSRSDNISAKRNGVNFPASKILCPNWESENKHVLGCRELVKGWIG